MTIEEKAKAYDMALEIAKAWYKLDNNNLSNDDLEKLFPELKESEDEKIRKEIIEFLELPHPQFVGKRHQEDWIAWLEKQGEQNDSDVKDYNSIDPHFGKSIDKIKPKFKIDDWVVCEVTGSVYQIKKCIENISNHKYGYDLTNGSYIGSDEINHYHLWTIQDAKDGDVLATKDAVFIFKHLDKTGLSLCKSYCEVIGNSELGLGFDFSTNGVNPATKEQLGFLFQKMKEAGYEWYPNSKELYKLIRVHYD